MQNLKIIFSLLALLAATTAFAQFDDPRADLKWFQIETEHFHVVYHEGTARTAQQVAKIAEEIYGPITTLYNHKPDQKVTFVIKDIADYSNGETNYYTNTIELWANGLDFDMRGSHNWLRNVISHEFTHDVEIQTAMKLPRRIPTIAFQYLGYENERRQDVLSGFPNRLVTVPIAGSVVPAWFAEGVAQYMRPELGYESWDAHRDMILRMAMLDSTLLTWNEMSTFGKTSFGDESSYNTGFALIRYIGQTYGDSAIKNISYALASIGRMTIDGAIEKALGITGAQLYDQWRTALRTQYVERIAPVLQHPVIGDTIGKVGFGNFYPSFSADGRTILYTSNKTSDFFSGAAFVCDPVHRTDTVVVPVSGRAVFAPDQTHVVYARRSRLDTHHSSFFRLHVYDRKTEDDKVISETWRGHSPNISPDGSEIIFVTDYDGTENLCLVDDPFGTKPAMHQITSFASGEQVYNPVFTRDGKNIVFDFNARDHREINIIDTAGKGRRTVLGGVHDYRSAAFSPDGRMICFACDSSGIYNIYRGEWDAAAMKIISGSIQQITNVPGGAFYPALDSAGDIAYSLFTSGGYKLAIVRTHAISDTGKNIEQAKNKNETPVASGTSSNIKPTVDHHDTINTAIDLATFHYINTTAPKVPPVISSGVAGERDWHALQMYNDVVTPEYASTTYKDIFTSLFIIPLIRIDTYNKYNTGLQNIKLGALFTSNDVTNRFSILAGGMTNSRFEYDLFAEFSYHDRVPLLTALGINPIINIGIYNSQRLTQGSFPVPINQGTVVDTLLQTVGATYNFLSFDISAVMPIISAAHLLTIDFNNTRYNASTDNFLNPQNGQLVALPSDLYLFTNTLSVSYDFKAIAPTRTEEINPIGREVKINIGQEWNNVEDTVVVGSDGLPQRLYLPYDYIRAGLQWHEHFALPFWSHTLSLALHAEGMLGGGVGAFNDKAHALFDTYIGGIFGMEGYPYYGLGATRVLSLKATYRFPVSTNLDLRLAGLYLDKIFLGVFGDYGAVWDGPLANAFTSPKRDVGAEFRMDAFIWYNIPLKLFFNVAYGLDQYEKTFQLANDQAATPVTYGKQWLYYFGIGFDFPD